MSTDTTSSSSRIPPASEHDGMADSFKGAMASLQELRAYFDQYLTAKVDGVKASVRTLLFYAALGILGAIVGMTAIVTATVLLFVGLAGALSALFGGMPWLANLLVGLLVVGGTGAGAWIVISKMLGRSRLATVRKYEAMRRRQEMNFGHHAEEKAHGHVATHA